MGFLTGGNQQTQPPVYGSIQVQTASSALPIPITWGVAKVAPNIIWNGGFYGVPANGKGGGKGAVLGKQQNPQDYYCSIVLALCEGPVGGISAVWDNSTISSFGNVASMPSPNFINGELGQAPWSLLTEDYPSQALGYTGTALVVDYQIALGESATLDSYNFEVIGIFQGSGCNGYDADPAKIVNDFLTNEQYGVGFPSSSIDMSTLIGSSGDSSYQSYCKAVGLALSPVLSDQETASSILARWLQLTNTAAVWSGGQLKFIPYGDTSATGTLYEIGGDGHLIGFGTSNTSQSYSYDDGPQIEIGTCTFNPNVTPIYNLTDDDYVSADNDDPVQVQRTDPYEAYNYQPIEIYQRSNFYDATEIDVWDQNAIDTYGLRKASTVTGHEICQPDIAQTAAQLILQRGLYIRNHYTFKLSWEYCLLEPMDIITLTDEILGLNNTAVRITDISEDDDGILSVTAEEFPNGVAAAVEYPVQAPSGTGIAANAPAPAINTPAIFEPPYGLAGDLEIWMAVSAPPDENWGGCYIWVSTDGNSYVQAPTKITAGATMGVLSAALPTIAGAQSNSGVVDNTNTLSVNLSESGGSLASTTSVNMLSGYSVCYVDGEMIAYENATLTGEDSYNLQPLLRGAYGSEISAHTAGSLFARIDANIWRQSYNPSDVGTTFYFKFQSFNTFGAGVQPLDAVGEYTYTLTGEGLQGPVETPVNLCLSFTAQFAVLTWDPVTDPRGQVAYQISQGSSSSNAQVVGTTATPSFNLLTPGTYYVRAYVVPIPNVTVYSDYSEGEVLSENMLVTNQLDSIDEQAINWPGTKVNMTARGTSANEILLLNPVTSVDYGTNATTITMADDLGITPNEGEVVALDLGTS